MARRSASLDHRPLRRDAELNLARIVVAARDVFAELGYEASMEQIAARADVGVGTLYRRFPTKADLPDAAKERTKEIAQQVMAEVPGPEAVFEFLRRCVAVPSCWRATISRSPWSGHKSPLVEVAPLIDRILKLSQQAGTVRRDVRTSDLVVLLMSVRAVADLFEPHAPGSARRFLELALDGLRPGQPARLPAPMTPAQLDDVFTR
jgi:AcrR family transcriptional regulator